MKESVWILPTYLFQSVFLLVAIALEARVLYQRLYLTRRRSVEYATSINLLATVVGWIAFFFLKDLLPQPIRSEIVSYIFFDRFLSPFPEGFYVVLASTGLIAFFSAFLIKLKGLQLLEALLERTPKEQSQPEQVSNQTRNRLKRRSSERIERAVSRTDPNQATVILLANVYSHSAIALLLGLRFIQTHTF
ncbi:MAG: filament integrity protein FraC [Coleofasciculaceae cyanobacterium]